jgi:hypothetical protein
MSCCESCAHGGACEDETKVGEEAIYCWVAEKLGPELRAAGMNPARCRIDPGAGEKLKRQMVRVYRRAIASAQATGSTALLHALTDGAHPQHAKAMNTALDDAWKREQQRTWQARMLEATAAITSEWPNESIARLVRQLAVNAASESTSQREATQRMEAAMRDLIDVQRKRKAFRATQEEARLRVMPSRRLPELRLNPLFSATSTDPGYESFKKQAEADQLVRKMAAAAHARDRADRRRNSAKLSETRLRIEELSRELDA